MSSFSIILYLTLTLKYSRDFLKKTCGRDIICFMKGKSLLEVLK